MNGRYYKLLRKKYAMTQDDVAMLIGISRHSLSTYEQEHSDMPVTVALRLNKLYGINGDDAMLRDN